MYGRAIVTLAFMLAASGFLGYVGSYFFGAHSFLQQWASSPSLSGSQIYANDLFCHILVFACHFVAPARRVTTWGLRGVRIGEAT